MKDTVVISAHGKAEFHTLSVMEEASTRVPRRPVRGVTLKLDPSRTGFLDLPGEIRNKVYRFASLAKHNPRAIACKLCAPFGVPLGLLLSCRQLYQETKDIWYEENSFVEVFTNCQDLPRQLTILGLPYIVSHDEITLRGGTRLMEKLRNPDIIIGLIFGCIRQELRTRYWFAAEDLQDFCAALWLLDRGKPHSASAGFKCLNLRVRLQRKPHPSRSEQIALLEPFRQLGNLYRAKFDGAVDADLATGLGQYLVNNQFNSPESVIERVIGLRGEGARQLGLHNYFGSAVRYEQALTLTDYLSLE